MKNKSGFSMVELLVSIIVASILILIVGVLSSTANRVHNNLNSEQQIYNDISYGFKLVQYKVRVATTIAAGNKPSPWINGQHFLIDSGVFGLCTYKFSISNPQCDATGTETALVYDTGVNQEAIFRVPSTGTITVSFPTLTANTVTISVSGTKNNIPFNMQTTVTRRNS